MKKVYAKPEVTKVELEEKHSVNMVNVNSKTGDIPAGPGIPFNAAAYPCLEETAPGSYFALGCPGGKVVDSPCGGVQPKNEGLAGEFLITDS